ncbi:MAG: hypothetical protein SGJ19_22825 [Planctomycetia bacterium]|nr:hypothetical protein [Planctomycetia bacterium]
MRYLLTAAILAVAGWLNFSPAPESPLVVHEWGTFTSFSDAKGELVSFRPLVANRLPTFVFDRQRQHGTPDVSFSKPTVWARQRMETPVTYFYTDRPRDVSVSVDFPQGFLTEFYPPVRKLLPPAEMWQWESGMNNARLDWGQVRLIPEAEFDRTIGAEAARAGRSAIPLVSGDDHYGHARATDSAIVEFANPEGHGTHYEKFLFYRGLGNFDQPAKLTAQGGGKFALQNDGDQDLPHVFLVEIEGHKVRYSYYAAAKAKATLAMELASEPSSIDAVADAMAESLVEAGLFEKEARSMVNTWRSSWFTESGTRVLYMLPQPWTEALIPLKIDPQPQSTLRVMVGRLEAMTPEQEKELATLIASDTPEAVVAAAPHNVLGRLGRFASAAAYHVGGQLPTEDLRNRANQISSGLCLVEDAREAEVASR